MRKTRRSLRRHDTGPHTLITTFLVLILAGPAPPDPATAPPTAGELVINEILYDPPGSYVEFVELYNRSQRTLTLESVRISDNRRRPVRLLPRNATLEPGAFIVVAQHETTFRGVFPDVEVLSTEAWPQLNNAGDAVLLWAGTTPIDSVWYEPNWGGRGGSLERIDPSSPAADPDNWHPSTAREGFTPGRHNSVYAPDTTPPQIVFAEQTSEHSVLLYANEPVTSSSVESARVSCGSDLRTAVVRLLADSRQIKVRSPDLSAASECIVQGLEDPAGNRLRRTAVPLARQPAPGDLVISEIMYQPLADPFDNRPDQPEYVELYNRSGTPLTVRSLYWTDRPDEEGRADTTFIGRSRSAVSPGGFAVIYADPDDEGTALRRAFPDLPPSVCLLPVSRRSLGLRSGGETIRLHGPGDVLLDQLHYLPGWHHPDVADGRGIALERIAVHGASDRPSNWSSSAAPRGGTPGRPNTLFPPERETASGIVTVDPSPFTPDGDGYEDHAHIAYDLGRPIASLRIRIFDAHGYLVRTLTDVRLTGSSGTIVWDGRDNRARLLPSGIYVVLLEVVDAAGGAVERHKAPVVVAR